MADPTRPPERARRSLERLTASGLAIPPGVPVLTGRMEPSIPARGGRLRWPVKVQCCYCGKWHTHGAPGIGPEGGTVGLRRPHCRRVTLELRDYWIEAEPYRGTTGPELEAELRERRYRDGKRRAARQRARDLAQGWPA